MASLWGEGYKKVMENPYYARQWIFQASNCTGIMKSKKRD